MMNKNSETLGMIHGLLEAWTNYHFSFEWKRVELTIEQKARLVQLFKLLDSAWVVKQMCSGFPSDKELLIYLSNSEAK